MRLDRQLVHLRYRQAVCRDPAQAQVAAPPAHLRHAAVLMPLTEREGEIQVLLTQRAAHLRHHAGQISFPGGRVERSDASPLATALREAEEEIHLPPSKVEVLGPLPPFVTQTSGFFIQPYLGFLHQFTVQRWDLNEVDSVFEVPLAFLVDPANRKTRRVLWQGDEHDLFEFPWQEKRIWGATASMIVSALVMLGLTTPIEHE
jgi:8-oxo-dGTP pyrophosphatase MutT (NUDIX family)